MTKYLRNKKREQEERRNRAKDLILNAQHLQVTLDTEGANYGDIL